MADIEDGRCHKQEAQSGPSLLQNGNLVFQAHHVGWIVATSFTLVAMATSFWLIIKHLQWYTNKREQRYIVRILLLVPIYAVISLASYFFWNHSTPLLLVRDCYESTVLTSFFYLLLNYLSPDPDEQRAIFMKVGLSREADAKARLAREEPKRWVFPLGSVKWKPSDGLYFLQSMKWGVLQYCVVRPLTTLAAVILDYMGLYCEESYGLGWGHIYIVVIVSLSVTIAMYCLIQLYVPVAEILRPHRPLLKLFAIKAVVFLTFWQATFLSILTMFGVVKNTKYMTASDINIGIGALLETFEMMLFGFLHIRAFTYKDYRPFHDPESKDSPPSRTPILRSLGHAMDFRETFREIWQGCVYMWDKMRGREPKHDEGAKRIAHYESAFGKARKSRLDGPKSAFIDRKRAYEVEKLETHAATFPAVHIDVDEGVDVGGQRQWLGLGNDYGYGVRRERSDSLEVQIERELERRGYGSHIPGRGHIKAAPTEGEPVGDHRQQRSWWRSVYNRVSQSGQDVDEEEVHTAPSRRLSKRKSKSKRSLQHSRDADARSLLHDFNNFEDPPPPSLIRTSRGHDQYSWNQDSAYYIPGEHSAAPHEDMLAPLSFHVQRKQHRHMSSSGTSKSRNNSRRVDSNSVRLVSTSSQLPSPVHLTRSDSLFGRVFPPSTDHATSIKHAPATHETNVYDIGLAGERSTLHAQVDVGAQLAANTTAGIPVEIVDPTFDDEMTSTQRSHERDSAIRRPKLHVDTSVNETNDTEIVYSSPDAMTPSTSPPPPFRGLRRSSAQVYSPSEVAARRQQHRASAPPRQHAYIPQPSNRPYPDYRLLECRPTSSTNPHASPVACYSEDNLGSNITQPSHSETLDAEKYPTRMGYPGLPLRPPDHGQYPPSSSLPTHTEDTTS
ncbi:organic solute transporter Ostalpha-domain-containing protein [Armillaria luteobubalina]|uniref:Organic solute transporter Ostalpha-domain-containing protein n=1 Tax=Armillaria luteobubalina TaxID=153913 RepID=A0AA39TZH7_9AGAR|nr:organic solute transporter Ostalpha-domain-containing protein [Armillaria luteobubalina]